MASYQEERARAAKADSILHHLRGKGITSADLDTMHPQQLATHIVEAGHDHASQETMDMVKSGMKQWEKPPLDDPFAGL
jgi:hypothetical protein